MVPSPGEFHSTVESGWPSTGRRTLIAFIYQKLSLFPCRVLHVLFTPHAHTDLEPYRMAMESSGFFCVHAEPFMEELASLQRS